MRNSVLLILPVLALFATGCSSPPKSNSVESPATKTSTTKVTFEDITQNAGMFWFTVPSPYVAHAPRLGRPMRIEPVFI